MVSLELKRDRVVFRYKGSKYEWIIEPRYWRKPLIGVFMLSALMLLTYYINWSFLATITAANLYAAMAIPLAWMTIGTGRMNFGPQFFVGVGGYTAALLSVNYGLNPVLTLLIAAFVSLAVGFLESPLSIVAGGLYYTVLTMLIPLAFLQLTFIYTGIFKGDVGLYGVAPLVSLGLVRLNYLTSCFLSMIMMLIFLFLVDKILRSRYGLIMASINDDEDAARAIGVNVNKIKIISCAIPACLLGIAGWFFAHYHRTFAGRTYLPLDFMIKILLIFMIGGRAQVYGVIMGAYFIGFLENFLLRTVGPIHSTIFPVILLTCLLVLPEGLWGVYRKRRYREYLPTMRVRRER